MANNKTGFNYYNLDTDRYQDIKIKRLKKDFGCAGIAVYDYIICEIYRVKGCFLEWDDCTAFDVADYFGIKESLVNEIVNYCGVVGLFNRELLTGGRIITSLSIQKRYLDMCSRAKRSNCDIPEKIKIPEKSNILPEESAKLPEKTTIIPEVSDKVKESKVNIPPLIPPGESSGKISGNPQKRKQPEALQFPFVTHKFSEAWAKLVNMPKWKKKLPLSLQMSLDKLAKYDEDFAIELINRAIEGNYQGVVFGDTDENYLKWKVKRKGHAMKNHHQKVEHDDRF